MKRPSKYLLIGLLILLFSNSKAQQIGFDFANGEKKISFQFERYNNLIIIPMVVNDFITLKFILDTGVQYPIITEKKLADLLDFNYSRRIVIETPGASDSISALVAPNVSLQLPGGVNSGINQSVLVLEEDYLDLSENLGVDVFGIIGYSLFSRFVVEINHDSKMITLHEPDKYRAKKFSHKIPLKIVNTKPYVETKIHINDTVQSSLVMLIDTGASHAMLLDSKSEGIILPAKTINTIVGRGLGGEISGLLGRISCFSLGKYYFQNPISSFPTDGEYGNAILRGSRNGTIGGEILSRFNMVFDYSRSALYLKKSYEYNKPFEYDMSGINLVVHDKRRGYLRVESLRTDSPASIIGIQLGDIITELNGFSLSNSSFNHIISILRHKDGKKINVKVIRNNEQLKYSFRLEKII